MKTIIFKRKGYDNEDLMNHPNFPKNNPIVVAEELSLIGVISSTEIRKRVQKNVNSGMRHSCGIAGLVTPSVLNFIIKNKLYTEFSQPIDLHVNYESPVVVREVPNSLIKSKNFDELKPKMLEAMKSELFTNEVTHYSYNSDGEV